MSGVEGVGMGVIYIIMLKFMKEAEDIVRKIFGIKSDSMPGFKGMGVMALGFMGKLGSAGSKGGSGGGKKGNKYKDVPDMKANQKQLQQNNITMPNPSGGQGGSQGGQGGQGPNHSQPQQQSAIAKAMDEYEDKLGGIVDRMGGARGVISKGIGMGAKLAGFGFGLGMTGELDQAIGFSAIAGNQAEKIDDALQDVGYRKQLDENEKVYKEEIRKYIENGVNNTHEFTDFSDGMKQVEEFRKKLSNGELDRKAFTPAQDRLARVIDDMTDTLDYGDIPDTDKYLKKLAYDIEDDYKKTNP